MGHVAWNKTDDDDSMKENDEEEVDWMKQEVDSKDRVMHMKMNNLRF